MPESVSRQDDGDGVGGKAEPAGMAYALPSSSSLVPWLQLSLRALFPPQASSCAAGFPANLATYEARQMVLPTFSPPAQEGQVAVGSGSIRNIDASYANEEQI